MDELQPADSILKNYQPPAVKNVLRDFVSHKLTRMRFDKDML